MHIDRNGQNHKDTSSSEPALTQIIPINILTSYFVDTDKLILKFVRRGKRPGIAITIVKKKNEDEVLILPNFKTSYKSYSNQDSMALVEEYIHKLIK